jgi:hypothetical protein
MVGGPGCRGGEQESDEGLAQSSAHGRRYCTLSTVIVPCDAVFGVEGAFPNEKVPVIR